MNKEQINDLIQDLESCISDEERNIEYYKSNNDLDSVHFCQGKIVGYKNCIEVLKYMLDSCIIK